MVSLTRRAVSVSGAALMAGCAAQQTTTAPAATAPAAPRAAIGAWGVDLAAIDANVRPGDDFFRHVNGTWMAANQIPADRVTWGTNDILAEKAERDVREIIEDAARSGGAPGSNAQKIADFYNAYCDQTAIDALGITPIQPVLTQINALRTHEDVIRLIARDDVGISSPIDLSIQLDEGNPDRYLPNLSHGGLGLPDREYYRRSDGQFPQLRAAYQAKIAEMLGLVGQTGTDAKARAVMALETQIAERHWPIADRRERDKTYNLRRRADVRAINPHYPWDAQFEATGITAGSDDVVIAELSAMGPLSQLFVATPVSTWKSYIAWHYVRGHVGTPGNERCDTIADAFATGKPVELYDGPRAGYTVDVHVLPDDTSVPARSAASGASKSKGAAYSYLSVVGGKPMRHKTWAECEQRVKGVAGARFKKAMSATDEVEILRGWRVNPSDL